MMSETPRPRRIPTELPVEVFTLDRAARATPSARAARLLDVNAGGVGIAHRHLNVDEGDVVCVRFPGFLHKSLSVCGTVRWWSATRLGIEIDQMGPRAMERFRELVEELVVDGYADE